MFERRNILIVRLFSIGDVVMSTSAVRIVRETIPHARISFLVGTWSLPVVELNPFIDEILVAPDNIFFGRRLLKLAKLALFLRKKQYDTTISLHGNRNLNRYLSVASGARRFFCLTYPGKRIPAAGIVDVDTRRHKVEMYGELAALAAGGMAVDHFPEPEMYLSDEEKREGEEIVAERFGTGDEIIAVCPGGGNNPGSYEPIKRWGSDHYAKLVRMIQRETEMNIVLLGSKEEKSLLDEIHSRNRKGVASISDLSLRDAASALSACLLTVGNDSGLMHIASAVGTPTVTIFGPTPPSHTRPYGRHARFVHKIVACNPCDVTKRDHRNPLICSTHLCMKSIEPQIVMDQIRELSCHARVIKSRDST